MTTEEFDSRLEAACKRCKEMAKREQSPAWVIFTEGEYFCTTNFGYQDFSRLFYYCTPYWDIYSWDTIMPFRSRLDAQL